MAVYRPKILNPPPLRRGTPRPEVVVDPTNQQARLINPTVADVFPGAQFQRTSTVGIPGASTVEGKPTFALGFHRGRIVTALPMKDRRLLVAPVVVHDCSIGYLADADGNLIGFPGQWVHRMLSAVSTPTGPRSSAGLQGY